MSARRFVVAWVGAALLAACSSQEPSRLDPIVADDPWASGAGATGSSASTAAAATQGADALGGMDLEGMLEKLQTALKTPGPYEAPTKSKGFDASKPHWGVLNLAGSVVEREAFSWSGERGVELRALVERLRALAATPQLQGVLLRVGSLAISLPDAMELRIAMDDLAKAGKKLACHAENASNTAYLVLAACERIGIAPLGNITITGPSAMPIHVKPLLDKLGVTADFLHVGAYKGAAEPLTRDAPSQEMRQTLGAILDRRYETMVDVIASERELPVARVAALIDVGLFPSSRARTDGLVDEVGSFESFRELVVGDSAWTKLELDPSGDDQLGTMFKVARFFGAMPPERPLGAHVAVVYALGNIVDGGGDGVLGAREEIASHTLVSALRAITADPDVKAVVLRIDSGGGSAQASELIWEAVDQLVAKKPVIVSMSDVAASGGYYIASKATKIFALEDTMTGSIGVVGGKISPAGALAKLGVRTFPLGRGKRATMMASLAPWTAEEKQVIQASMEAVYQTFVGRVAEGRSKKVEEVLPLAQGRVWTGAQAKQLGLVDEIGGLDAAIAEARKLAQLDGATGLAVYPPAPTLRDLITGFGEVQAPLGVEVQGALAALGAADPAIAREAARLMALALSFRTTTIQAVTVLPVVQ